MNQVLTRGPVAIAAAVAAIVLVAGMLFAFARGKEYESSATIVLTPDTLDVERTSSLLESFERSGTLGTYVELLASDDTTAEARDRGVGIVVRAVPDTRTIRLGATGGEEDVQPALRSVIANGIEKQSALRDLWVMNSLERASSPAESGPSTGLILFAAILLAFFAGVATYVLLRRFAPAAPQAERYAVEPDELDEEERLTTAR